MESLDNILQRATADMYEPSDNCKSLILRSKKKNDKGLFSWDDAFYKANSFWFTVIWMCEIFGLVIIFFTSFDLDMVFLFLKIGLLLFLAIADFIIAKTARQNYDRINRLKAKETYYEMFFEIYEKPADENKKAKDLNDNCIKEKRKLINRSYWWLVLLIFLGVVKIIVFFLDSIFAGKLNSVVQSNLWIPVVFCLIYLTVPWLHWFYYSYLYWIKFAYDKIVKELNEHSVIKNNAIDRTDKAMDVNNCKKQRVVTFDVQNLKNAYKDCETVFAPLITSPRTWPGLLTDGDAEQMINNERAIALATDTQYDARRLLRFLHCQLLKFQIDLSETLADSGVGHYDEKTKNIIVTDNIKNGKTT